MSREHYRKTRSNEAQIWYKDVAEKKSGPGKGNHKPKSKKKYIQRHFNLKQVRLRSGPQYKLFSFIAKFFDGNVSRASKEFGMDQSRLASVLSKGILKRSVIDNIVECAKRIDPGQTEKKLFIPPKKVVIVRRKREEKPDLGVPIIRPSMGGFVQINTGGLSAAIARINNVA